MKKHSATGGVQGRRERALERLQQATFTPKKVKGKERTEEQWAAQRDREIETLQSRLR